MYPCYSRDLVRDTRVHSTCGRGCAQSRPALDPMTAQPPSLDRDLRAAFDWWRDAGVDLEFADDVTDWFDDEDQDDSQNSDVQPGPSDKQTRALRPLQKEDMPVAAVKQIDLLGESPPTTLEAFHTFWLEAPGLDVIGPRGRIAPRGSAGAELMILVVDPEEADRDRLLSGPQGRLLERILAAMGFTEDQVYVAAALPSHTPMADTQAIASSGMQHVLLHHIKLAAPKRIVALGANILPLLGNDRAQDIMSLREIHHDDASTPLMVSEGLDSMMSMPRLKARFWRRWMEWSQGQ